MKCRETKIALEKLVGRRFEDIKELQKELRKISINITPCTNYLNLTLYAVLNLVRYFNCFY